MELVDLAWICGTAFVAVFLLLIILALVIRVVTAAFPAPALSHDGAVLAAVEEAVGEAYPGARVTRIEEER